MEFGEYLRIHRVKSGKSLRYVASELGLCAVYLSEIERGIRPILPKKYWPKLLYCLDSATEMGLSLASVNTRPLQIQLSDKSERCKELCIVIDRKIQQGAICDDTIEKIIKILDVEGK